MKLRSHAAALAMSCLLAFVPVALLFADPAQSASCAGLSSELARLQSGGGQRSAGARKWETAKTQQQKALSAAERDLSYFGCGTVASPQCKSLSGKVQRMRANLAAIERQLAKSGGGASNTKRIRQLQAALHRQNCGAPAPVQQASAPQDNASPRSFLARLFNPQEASEQPAPAVDSGSAKPTRSRSSSSYSLPSGGTFRTLCVRTCDGYFFPVSFSTGKKQFANDAARCTEICPASETELYVYKNPGSDQSTMMSLAGDLYSEQPFAYRYKSEFVEGCSCRQAGAPQSRSAWTELRKSESGTNRIVFSDISGGLPATTAIAPQVAAYDGALQDTPSPLARVPLTKSQLPAYEDPDTRTNLEKGFDVTIRLTRAADRLATAAANPAVESRPGELPLLGRSKKPAEDGLETASIPPVFKSDDPGFRPAPNREAPVRVVGPEYFVAQ